MRTTRRRCTYTTAVWAVSTGAQPMVVYQPPLRITIKRSPPATCLSWISAEQLGGVGGIYPLHRPRLGWREDAVLRLVLEHRKEPYDRSEERRVGKECR